MPLETPGLRFLCREPYDLGRGSFDRPLSSRFDEEDALALFDDVLVPWERVFVAGDLTAYNDLIPSVPGLTFLQAATRAAGQAAIPHRAGRSAARSDRP